MGKKLKIPLLALFLFAMSGCDYKSDLTTAFPDEYKVIGNAIYQVEENGKKLVKLHDCSGSCDNTDMGMVLKGDGSEQK